MNEGLYKTELVMNRLVSKQLYSRAEYWYGKMFLDVF